MNIVITGGGTGGHLTIAKAIKERLNKEDIQPIFIGSTHGQDRDWFEFDEGFERCYFFETSGVVNQRYLGKVFALFKIFISMWQCRTIFKKHHIDVVFSVGGYSAAPASLASLLFGKKLYIHEQNAVIGRLNKLLAPKAENIFSSYLAHSPLKDYPIREIFFDNARIREKINTIIFLGGSQGATAINKFAMSVAPLLDDKGIKIIHQCGLHDEAMLRQFYQENHIAVDLFAFSTHLETKIKEADFAICRAGASTLWELCASKLPALYIPYPYAAGNHQYHNANFLAERKLSFVVTQEHLKVDDFVQIFEANIKQMSMGLGDLVAPNGAQKIVDYMLKDKLR
ncbi:MAG: UDP-N-acetylglucosamine--N-acetylmuramyl-(pentapeptide) pyrophosphoryl-undecaprenol N-acetylglucosamine transferase [Epsilonproteobacteria bacterium]|nr:UDP-N-acetylglucosamine--N-acetylmuramyl-(pentapeptide) pyrophosphoryl-undecaprenol N-acetylglucosamine transferase [Campylobacterota bacterium]